MDEDNRAPAQLWRLWPPSRLAAWTGGLLLVAGVGFADYITGPYISVSVFYLMPVFLMAWLGGKRAGLVGALASALAWLAAQKAAPPTEYRMEFAYWNSVVELTFFITVAVTAHALKEALNRESDLARTDDVTGLPNRRCFFETAERELQRVRRYGRPLSLAYLDLDRFKEVNDQGGHAEGDAVLRKAARAMRSCIRSSDLLGRVGGDEFALLLLETDEQGARLACEKLALGFRRAVQEHPSLSLSIGLASFQVAPESIDHLIREADLLMYRAKAEGGGQMKSGTFEPESPG